MPPKAKRYQGQPSATSANRAKASCPSPQTRSSAATATAAATATVPVRPKDVPRWPALTPKPTLSLVPVLDSQIYLIPAFLTSKECTALITHTERHIPLTQVSTIPKRGEAFRSNDRTSFIDPVLALTLWNLGLGSACRGSGALIGDAALIPCGLNTNIRVYRYTAGQRFEPHYDDSTRDPVTGMGSEWTLLVYLTGAKEDGLEGCSIRAPVKIRTKMPSWCGRKGVWHCCTSMGKIACCMRPRK